MIFTWFTGGSRNVGVEMGLSGLLVIDEDQPDAFVKYAADHGGQMPPTFTVKTANGRHYYFQDSVDGHLGNTEGRQASTESTYAAATPTLSAPDPSMPPVMSTQSRLLFQWLGCLIGLSKRSAPSRDRNPITDTRCPLPKRFSIQTLADTSASPRSSRTTTGTTHSWGTRAPCGPGTSRQQRRGFSLGRRGRTCEQPPTARHPSTEDEAIGTLEDVYKRYPAGRSEGYWKQGNRPPNRHLRVTNSRAPIRGDGQTSANTSTAPTRHLSRISVQNARTVSNSSIGDVAHLRWAHHCRQTTLAAHGIAAI
jgi:hypothetical protein